MLDINGNQVMQSSDLAEIDGRAKLAIDSLIEGNEYVLKNVPYEANPYRYAGRYDAEDMWVQFESKKMPGLFLKCSMYMLLGKIYLSENDQVFL